MSVWSSQTLRKFVIWSYELRKSENHHHGDIFSLVIDKICGKLNLSVISPDKINIIVVMILANR